MYCRSFYYSPPGNRKAGPFAEACRRRVRLPDDRDVAPEGVRALAHGRTEAEGHTRDAEERPGDAGARDGVHGRPREAEDLRRERVPHRQVRERAQVRRHAPEHQGQTRRRRRDMADSGA